MHLTRKATVFIIAWFADHLTSPKPGNRSICVWRHCMTAMHRVGIQLHLLLCSRMPRITCSHLQNTTLVVLFCERFLAPEILAARYPFHRLKACPPNAHKILLKTRSTQQLVSSSVQDCVLWNVLPSLLHLDFARSTLPRFGPRQRTNNKPPLQRRQFGHQTKHFPQIISWRKHLE